MTGRPLSEFVASRRIGAATVTVISEGSLRWAPRFLAPEAEWRRAMPAADADGKVPLGLNLVHISLGEASVVVDPGLDDPGSVWQQGFAAKWPGLRRSPGLEAALAGLGVLPGRITHVLITHAHTDHFAGVAVEQGGKLAARFPHARHLIGRRDWEGNSARATPESDLAVRLGLIERQGLLELVDGEREIVPGLAMLPAPGETPGHYIVRLRSAGECFFYLGDLFHLGCEVEHPEWVPAGRDRDALRASRGRLIAEACPGAGAAAQRAILVFAHERFPAWGRIVPAGGGYEWVRI